MINLYSMRKNLLFRLPSYFNKHIVHIFFFYYNGIFIYFAMSHIYSILTCVALCLESYHSKGILLHPIGVATNSATFLSIGVTMAVRWYDSFMANADIFTSHFRSIQVLGFHRLFYINMLFHFLLIWDFIVNRTLTPRILD